MGGLAECKLEQITQQEFEIFKVKQGQTRSSLVVILHPHLRILWSNKRMGAQAFRFSALCIEEDGSLTYTYPGYPRVAGRH